MTNSLRSWVSIGFPSSCDKMMYSHPLKVAASLNSVFVTSSGYDRLQHEQVRQLVLRSSDTHGVGHATHGMLTSFHLESIGSTIRLSGSQAVIPPGTLGP